MPRRITTLLDDIKGAAGALVSSGELGIKDAATQKKIAAGISNVYNLADLIINTLVQAAVIAKQDEIPKRGGRGQRRCRRSTGMARGCNRAKFTRTQRDTGAKLQSISESRCVVRRAVSGAPHRF